MIFRPVNKSGCGGCRGAIVFKRVLLAAITVGASVGVSLAASLGVAAAADMPVRRRRATTPTMTPVSISTTLDRCRSRPQRAGRLVGQPGDCPTSEYCDPRDQLRKRDNGFATTGLAAAVRRAQLLHLSASFLVWRRGRFRGADDHVASYRPTTTRAATASKLEISRPTARGRFGLHGRPGFWSTTPPVLPSARPR